MSPEAARGPTLRRPGDRVFLLTALVFVTAAALTPVGRWKLLAAEGLILAFAVGLSGIDPKTLIRRWFGFALLFGFLAVMVAQSHPERRVLGFGPVVLGVLAKNGLALVAMITLAHVVPLHRLVKAARGLGFPEVLASPLMVLDRYRHVLFEERDRMMRARRARTFGRSGRIDWGRLATLIGLLFVRSFERGERVHAAMVARGWDGTWRDLDGEEGTP